MDFQNLYYIVDEQCAVDEVSGNPREGVLFKERQKREKFALEHYRRL